MPREPKEFEPALFSMPRDDVAWQYIYLRDFAAHPQTLLELGEENLRFRDTEHRFYGAWALLEAGLNPMLNLTKSSLKSLPEGTADAAVNRGLHVMSGLANRTPFYSYVNDFGRLNFTRFRIGFKAQMVRAVEPFLRGSKMPKIDKQISNNFEDIAALARQQFVVAQDSLSRSKDEEARSRVAAVWREMRGVEPEVKTMGAVWKSRSVNKATKMWAVPASPRYDFGLHHDIRGGRIEADVLVGSDDSPIHGGIQVQRNVMQARQRDSARENRRSISELILSLYGDRDLWIQHHGQITPVEEPGGVVAITYEHKFDGWDEGEALRIVRQMSQALNRV